MQDLRTHKQELEDTIDDFLGDGTLYEPRPGRLRKL